MVVYPCQLAAKEIEKGPVAPGDNVLVADGAALTIWFAPS